MESDDENLIIPPEHLNLSDEPELELSDEPIPDPGAALGADSGPAQASGDQANTGTLVPRRTLGVFQLPFSKGKELLIK